MRPVNLMPAGERRGEGAPTRTGPLAYIIVGVLAVALAAVCGIVVFNKKVSDREAEATRIEAHATELEARADGLSSFVTFKQIHDSRVQTVEQLAQSRFDWERVLRELSKVIPSHIWLVSLTGTVTPDVDVGDGAGDDGGLRESIPGPALVLTGCGRSHDDVARLVAAMKDIDGVTRVTASDSAKPDTAIAAGAAGSSDNCQTRSSIPQFHLVASFDEVVVPAADGTVPPAGSRDDDRHLNLDDLDLDLDGGRGRWRAGGRGAERGDQAGRLQCRPAGQERNQPDPGRLT